MSQIDAAPRLRMAAACSASVLATGDAAELLCQERLMRGSASDRGVGRGILIVPAVLALAAAGWLVPTLALLYLAAPVAAVLLLLADQMRPVSPRDAWHGR